MGKSHTESTLRNTPNLTVANIEFGSINWQVNISEIDDDYINLDLISILNFNLSRNKELYKQAINNGAKLIFSLNKEIEKTISFDLCLELKKYNETLQCGKAAYHYRVLVGYDSFNFTKDEIFPSFIGTLPSLIYIFIKANSR